MISELFTVWYWAHRLYLRFFTCHVDLRYWIDSSLFIFRVKMNNMNNMDMENMENIVPYSCVTYLLPNESAGEFDLFIQASFYYHII